MKKDYQYIKYFPKPFLEDLVKDRVLPFIGAGFSKNAIIPKGVNMLNWDELGRAFADLIPDYQYSGAIDAISSYSYEFSRAKLIEKMSELLLTGEIKAGNTHKAFCKLPFQQVCTTNFDFLIEQGYEQVSRYCRPIIEEGQLSIANNNPKEVGLLKIHGDLNHPNRLVATEEDYDAFINNHPMLSTFLANLLISKTIFFIGYSVDDPDLRQIWQLVKDRLGNLRRQAYTLRIDSTPQENSRFERRGVKVISIPRGNKSYSQVLEDVLEELRDYWSEEYPNYITVTEEDSLIEFSLPKERSSRLCYFSVPKNQLSLYKKYIFPIAENMGFAPITVDDILSPGDNFLPKISALIDRSSVIILDVSSSNAKLEMGMIRSRQLNDTKVVLVANESHQIPSSMSDNVFIIRNNGDFEYLEDFVDKFESYFLEISSGLKEGFEVEPERLFKKKEYKAAAISIMTLLEFELRNKFEETLDFKFRPYSLRQMIQIAIKNQYISQEHYPILMDWIGLRNELVHTPRKLDGRTAKKLVSSVTKIISELKGK